MRVVIASGSLALVSFYVGSVPVLTMGPPLRSNATRQDSSRASIHQKRMTPAPIPALQDAEHVSEENDEKNGIPAAERLARHSRAGAAAVLFNRRDDRWAAQAM